MKPILTATINTQFLSCIQINNPWIKLYFPFMEANKRITRQLLTKVSLSQIKS